MLKMYGRVDPLGHGGGESPEQWTHAWGTFDHAAWLRDAARICHNDPISRWVEPAVARGGLFLEGGCGLSHWVKWLHHRGQAALGVDFAPRLLASAQRLDAQLRLVAGDVRALPLADGSVHTYLSNGVVEHWEDGPEAGLAEARRVLAPDGLFLCTVPDESWLRGYLYRGDMAVRGPLAARHVDEPRVEPTPAGWSFYQYAFTPAEFVPLLEAAGFEVVETVGQSLIHGLFEVPGLEPAYQAAYRAARGLTQRLRQRHLRQSAAPAPASPAPLSPTAEPEPFALDPRSTPAERLFFREEPDWPLLGPLVAWAAEHCSTMRMYVARCRR